MPKTQTVIKEKETIVQSEETSETKIAVMKNDIKHITESLTRIENTLQIAINGFVTVDKLNDVIEASNKKHDGIDKEIEALKNWNTWAVRLVVGSILTGLVTLGIYLFMAALK